MKAKDLIKNLADIKKCWLDYELEKEETIDGIIFSILVLIDGDCSLNDFEQIGLVERDGKFINKGVELHDLWCKYRTNQLYCWEDQDKLDELC